MGFRSVLNRPVHKTLGSCGKEFERARLLADIAFQQTREASFLSDAEKAQRQLDKDLGLREAERQEREIVKALNRWHKKFS